MNSSPDGQSRIESLRGQLRAKLPRFMALRVAREIESGQFDSALDSRAAPATLLSMTKVPSDPNLAIPAGGTVGNSTGPGIRLRLTLDRTSAANRWASSASAAELWNSTGAGVDLVVGTGGKFATVEVIPSDQEVEILPSNWRFEAVALGLDEMPDPHRKIGNPKMDGMPIPLITTGKFRLDQPIRVALYVSDAGQTSLGCLVFVPRPE